MPTTPIHVFARWKVKEGHLQAVLQLLKEVGSKTRLEQGNMFYKVQQSQAYPNTLVLFEGDTDIPAQQAHVSADYYKKLVSEQIVPLVEERGVILAIPIED